MSADQRLLNATRAIDVGDDFAERRLLHERLRAGTLDQRRLELAAFAGHPAARGLLDTRLRGSPHDYHPEQGCCQVPVWDGEGMPHPEHAPGELCLVAESLEEWCQRLAGFGRRACIVAAAAVLRCEQPGGEVLSLVEGYLADPSPEEAKNMGWRAHDRSTGRLGLALRLCAEEQDSLRWEDWGYCLLNVIEDVGHRTFVRDEDEPLPGAPRALMRAVDEALARWALDSQSRLVG